MVTTRYILRLEPIASTPPEQLVATVGPTVHRYLTGDLNAELTDTAVNTPRQG